VLIATKEAISTAPFLSISIDEIIIIDNQSWISIHCYVEEGWKHVLILFTFEWLVECEITTNIKVVIYFATRRFGGIFKGQIVEYFCVSRSW
jgi:hypothetical protein